MRRRRLVALAFFLVACGSATGPVLDPMLDGGPDLPDGGDEASAPDAAPVEGGVDGGASDAMTTDAPADATSDAADAGPEPVLLRFAVIGDYGNDSTRELAVANLVLSWNPEIIVTTGDNNYGTTGASFDPNIGQYYHSFLSPYAGAYGPGAAQQALFPAIGNHDWDIESATAYLAFFSPPGNGLYYDLDRGPVHFVVLDSDPREPDGTTPVSTQGVFAQTSLANSTKPYNVVLFHHPAITSGSDKSQWMDWPFKAWGADAVMTGHVHNYERLRLDGLSYFVVGQSGFGTSSFAAPLPSSEKRYNAMDGAALVEVTASAMRLRYYNVTGALIDTYALSPTGTPVP